MTAATSVRPGGRVFITGATGLVGSHVALLLRSEGYEVRALHRSRSDTRHLESAGCELIEGDMQDTEARFERALEGCDGLVHAAAVVYSELPWPRVRAINVTGTGRLFRAARRAGLVRAVHLSSVAVYGDRMGLIDETTPLDTPLRPRQCYARSKRESEREVQEAMDGSPMGVAVLRPSVLYGERDRLFTPKMIRILRLPLHPLLGGGRATIPIAYAGNVAHAILTILGEPIPSGVRVFNLAEDEPLTQRELYAGLADGLGRSFRPVSIPAGVARSAASLGDRLGLRLPGAEELSFRRVVRLTLRANPYDSSRIRDELGWRPPVSAEEALRRTAGFLRDPTDGDAGGADLGGGTSGAGRAGAFPPASAAHRDAVSVARLERPTLHEEVPLGRG